MLHVKKIFNYLSEYLYIVRKDMQFCKTSNQGYLAVCFSVRVCWRARWHLLVLELHTLTWIQQQLY
jgi:hypothetical protein